MPTPEFNKKIDFAAVIAAKIVGVIMIWTFILMIVVFQPNAPESLFGWVSLLTITLGISIYLVYKKKI